MRTLVAIGSTIALLASSGALSGCTGDIMDRPGGPYIPEQVSLGFTSPAPQSVHVRDDLDEVGALVAAVDLQVSASGIDRVVFSSLPGPELGESTGPDFMLPAGLTRAGTHMIVATGYAGDEEVATASVEITVEDPNPADCHAWLDLYGLQYELGPDRQGVADPVTVTTPINGMIHRYVSNDTPRSTFFMDCTLALSLARAAPHLRRRDIVELVDIGVYNYRCIGGGTPPDCPNGISQHAYAKGIDIAGVTDKDGVYYSVNDDWVIDPDNEPTCSAATEPGKDAFLHELICALKADHVWNIVLTPNYNSAHRNHFHVDLTTGSDYIRMSRTTPVDIGPDNH
jgi:hypothetical protein